MTHLDRLNRYTCEEAVRRLDDYLDRELTPDETVLVQDHLEICAGCAREFNFEASVLRGVRRKLRQIDLPTSLQSRILRVLNDQR